MKESMSKSKKEAAMTKIGLVCGLLLISFFAPPLYGADAALSLDPWEIHLVPYFYMPSADADLDIGGLSGPVNLSLSEMVESLDFASMGRIEAWNGRWGLLFDGLFFNLEVPASFISPTTGNPVDAALDERVGRADFALSYRLLEGYFDENQRRRIIVAPYAGLRYAYLKQVVDLEIALNGLTSVTLGHSEDWVEPFVGGIIRWDLNQTIAFDIRGDAGGFGIGSASDLTWQIAFALDYKVSDKISLNAGYRIMDLDYHRGSGLDELGIDVRAKGPFFGFTFLF